MRSLLANFHLAHDGPARPVLVSQHAYTWLEELQCRISNIDIRFSALELSVCFVSPCPGPLILLALALTVFKYQPCNAPQPFPLIGLELAL